MMAETKKHAITIFAMFVSCHLSGGITNALYTTFSDLCGSFEGFEHQSGVLDTIKEKWTQIKDGKSAAKMFGLISFAIVAVLSKIFGFDASKFDFKKYMSLGRPESKGSIVEHIIDDAIFFIEKGLIFFKTGSFKNLFIDEVIAKEYDEEFAFLVGHYQNVEIDSMESGAGISLTTYLARLEQCVSDTQKMAKGVHKHSERRFLTDRHSKLLKMCDVTRKIVLGKNARIKPFGIMLEGRSGVGKTNLKGLLIRLVTLCNPKHFSGDEKSICTMNGDDPYQTELTNSHQVIILDDMALTINISF